MKLDVLAFGAHPDDVELACSGTLIKFKKQGKRIGIADLTKGELGTRGSAEIREEEALEASRIMGIEVRENLDMGDAWFESNRENKLKVIRIIRKYRPEILLINAVHDRHTDHPKAGQLVKEAAFLSGLAKISTEWEGEPQEHWRPVHVFQYIQYHYIKPDFIVDITAEFETKKQAILAYKSQFYNPGSGEPDTLISSEDFLKYIDARAREMGSAIRATYGEGFTVTEPLNIDPLHFLG